MVDVDLKNRRRWRLILLKIEGTCMYLKNKEEADLICYYPN